METHLHLKGGASQLHKQLLVLWSEEGHSLVLVAGQQHVTQRDVLKALVLADIVVCGGRDWREEEEYQVDLCGFELITAWGHYS